MGGKHTAGHAVWMDMLAGVIIAYTLVLFDAPSWAVLLGYFGAFNASASLSLRDSLTAREALPNVLDEGERR